MAMAVPTLTSPGAVRHKDVRSWGHDKIPDVLGQHALAGGGTPDPGNATFRGG